MKKEEHVCELCVTRGKAILLKGSWNPIRGFFSSLWSLIKRKNNIFTTSSAKITAGVIKFEIGEEEGDDGDDGSGEEEEGFEDFQPNYLIN